MGMDGGANLAATASIRNGWRKFWELLPFLTYIAPRQQQRPPPIVDEEQTLN